jgi:hypothetical protein
MKQLKNILFAGVLIFFIPSCLNQPNLEILTDARILHDNQKQLTEVIIYDAFNPPVASRIYAYTSLAAYEAIRYHQPDYPSITAQLNAFPQMPEPDKNKTYNYLLAATKAFFTVAESLTFSIDTLKKYEAQAFKNFRNLLDKDVYEQSMAFGEAVGKKILERSTKDNYKKTRGMAKYLGSNDPGKWRPTPPDYLDGAEPYWNQILPLVLDSCSQFRAAAPYSYNRDTTTNFFKSVYEVYTIGKNLTEEQKTIARYWDDNPFVIEHSGHLLFANKKITPVGHWIGITTIACKMKNTSPIETAQAYAITAVAFFDAFIACWDEKYRSNLVRPVTVINELVDQNWQPYLQTPPFPEHTSGHSSISAAAATVLTKRFGDNFVFEDTSDLEYIGMKRNFTSFMQAALEASMSRVYGGIHYRSGVEEGTLQGKRIGEYINQKIVTR